MTDIVHFHNGKGGGVWSVIKNLIESSKDKSLRNHVIFVIEESGHQNYKVPEIKGVVSARVFYYSRHWNFYHTCKSLKKLLPGEDAIIVAHDWLELGMVSNLGLQNTMIQFLHGDYSYYYDLAVKHSSSIDAFICVAENIERKLKILLPQRIGSIKYLRFPVPAVSHQLQKQHESNNIVFIGRLGKGKGYDLLPGIAGLLSKEGIAASWHIAGADEGGLSLLEWPDKVQIKFYGEVSSHKIAEILSNMNFIILPSEAEGMPVAIIEAMKAGVIPLTSDLEGGIQELVIDNITGFKIKSRDALEYANKLASVLSDYSLREVLSKNCIDLSTKLFDPFENTQAIETFILKVAGTQIYKKALKTYGSRLDHPLFPSSVTAFFRKKIIKRKRQP